MSYGTYKQGYYTPKNPNKYIGRLDNIVFRSSWEESMMRFLDYNPNVIKWSSEPIAIPYIKPTDGKLHRYFPDFFVEIKNSKGVIVQEIVEIKPAKETRQSTSRSKKGRLTENLTYAVNIAKWKAAAEWCHKNGLKFRVLTENQLFK